MFSLTSKPHYQVLRCRQYVLRQLLLDIYIYITSLSVKGVPRTVQCRVDTYHPRQEGSEGGSDVR